MAASLFPATIKTRFDKYIFYNNIVSSRKGKHRGKAKINISSKMNYVPKLFH